MKKHDASSLHYDLRLEWNGVLKSFVVEQGPSDVADNPRKTLEVEDHAREYAAFEGVIPKGKYGAGTVMLWDSGMYKPLPEYADVGASLRNGLLRFILNGEKLKGGWTLKRRDERLQNEKNPVWDLIKEPDSFARNGRSGDILEEAPNSVAKGRRTLKEIERDWNEPKKKSGATLFDM
jgi:bifunctional non-homologous end joining protein LigD